MITEFIKRGYRKGYDENGVIVYKIPVNEVPEQEEELELFEEQEED